MEKRHDLHSDLKQIEREFLHIGEDEVKEESKSEENVTPTASEIVVGKQRFFPTGGQIQFPSDEDTDVFGAVKSEESEGVEEAKQEADEFGLLHSILYQSDKKDR